jgi:hypothetical protein
MTEFSLEGGAGLVVVQQIELSKSMKFPVIIKLNSV